MAKGSNNIGGNPPREERAAMDISRKLFGYIHDWVHEYLPKFRSGSEQTIRSYSMTANLYMTFLKEGGAKVSTIKTSDFSPDMIRKWLMWLKDKRGNSGSTINVRLAILRSMLRYLAIRDASLVHIWNESKLVEEAPESPRDVTGISMKALAALLDAIDDTTRLGIRDYTIVLILYAVAARIDECLSLRVSDLVINEENNNVTLLGKGRKKRTLALPEELVNVLKRYLSVFHGDKPCQSRYLFYSPVHGEYGKLSQECIRKRLRKYAAKAHEQCDEVPLDLAAHKLRHTRANQWRRENINIFEIQSLMGHSSINATMVYQDVTYEEKKAALEKLGVETNADDTEKWSTELVDDLVASLGVEKK